ncbi:hypothetical protein ACWF94_20400, partial [Streptomyces sp. NPDC055078]
VRPEQGPWNGKGAVHAAQGSKSGNGQGSEMNPEQLDLETWRAAMMSDLNGTDIGLATRALLALTYDDPDRKRVEAILLDRLASDEADGQIKALAVTCVGHLGRIHKSVSTDAVHRLEGLLDDPVLGGLAEDALGDLNHFVRARADPPT